MSWLSELFHPERAYDKASQTSDKYYQQSQGFNKPYADRGNAAGNDLMGMLQKLMNPGKLQDEWSKGYETSDYAKQTGDAAQTAGLDAASAMGLGGSSAALSNIQKDRSNIVGADKQQYMNDLMQKYMQSIGIGENLSGTGAGAVTNMSNNATKQGEDQAGLEYGKNSAGGNFLANLLGKGASIFGNYLTGGFGSGGFGRGAFQPDWMNK